MAHGGSLDLVQPLGAYLFTKGDEDTITQMLRHELLGHECPGQHRGRANSKAKKQHTNFKNLKGFTRVNALFKAVAVRSAPLDRHCASVTVDGSLGLCVALPLLCAISCERLSPHASCHRPPPSPLPFQAPQLQQRFRSVELAS